MITLIAVFGIIIGIPTVAAAMWVIREIHWEDQHPVQEDLRQYIDSYYDDHWY